MKTVQLTDQNHQEIAAEAVEILQEGGVVLLPTDTAYGLAAAADSDQGIDYVLKLKGRETAQPMSVVVAGQSEAEKLVDLSGVATKLWQTFLPGALTVIAPVKKGVKLPAALTRDGAVGLREPDYPLCREIAERLGKPYTATSANRSGQPPAYEPAEFLDTLTGDERPHLVVDAGRIPIVPVSTVVKVAGDSVEILREGAIPTADIMKRVGDT